MIYWPTIHFDFVSIDDPEYVYSNPHIQQGLTWETVKWTFTGTAASNWHPLSMLSHALDVQLFGLNAGPHHLVNVVLHAINSIVLFFLLRSLTGAIWRSAFVALLFAVHPLRVESVAWVAERKDLLCALFYLLTIWSYAAWVKKSKLVYYVATLLLYAGALMSKPMAVTAPFVLLLLDYWPLRRFPGNLATTSDTSVGGSKDAVRLLGRLIVEKIPLFVMSAVTSVVASSLGRTQGNIYSVQTYSYLGRLGDVATSYVLYLRELVWPFELAPRVDLPKVLNWFHIGMAFALLVAVTLVAVRLRRKPFIAVGWFWFLGTLVPVIGFVPVGVQAQADRFTYIPCIGFLIAMIWGAGAFLAGGRWIASFAGAIVATVTAGLIVLSRQQVGIWENSERLYTSMVTACSDNYIGHNLLGSIESRRGQHKDAIEHFEHALRVVPSYPDAHNNLGAELALKGHMSEAAAEFEAALRLKPRWANPEINWAHSLADAGRFEEALTHYLRAVELGPEISDTRTGLGVCYEKLGKNDDAAQAFREALRINPNNALAHACLGKVLVVLNHVNEGIGHYSRSIELFPGNPDIQTQFGLLLALNNNFPEAEKHLREALRLNPSASEAKEALEEIAASRHEQKSGVQSK